MRTSDGCLREVASSSSSGAAGCRRSKSVRWAKQRRCTSVVAQDSATATAGPESAASSNAARSRTAASSAEALLEPVPMVAMPPLPEKNLGTLRGGMYPFVYDPVYGLPLVQEVAKYGEVLRDMREGRVKEVLWFNHQRNDVPQLHAFEGRCLIRYTDDRVKQSVLMPEDMRIKQAMDTHAVKSISLPPEPRHVAEWALADNAAATLNPVSRWMRENVNYFDDDDLDQRRGPRIGPTPAEVVMLPEMHKERQQMYNSQIAAIQEIATTLERMPTEDFEAYLAVNSTKGGKEMMDKTTSVSTKPASWMDNIQITQDQQALILRLAPILGPIIGSAFIIGLYMAARLVRGDLTDRMKMMNQEDDKKKRTALKEARIAFLEEEVPALVAKGASLAEVKVKCKTVNSKLGSKFEIGDVELEGTYDACTQLLREGTDISGIAGSSSAAERILAEEEQKEREAAQKEVNDGGEPNPEDAFMEMGKLNTARVRKAIDPKILDVKRRVRQARRSLKRESKVQLSDEIIFFDDVAGNAQAKVELLEVVDFFRKPEKFRSSGAKVPKGVLLVGPPGNGKTLMARAVAGESGVAFISSSASEFIEMYMGLGAARVRDLFNTARNLSPCIIFIDELDAVGRARRGNDERDNTVNQLLTELDGFEADTAGIVVMAATNRKDVLDAALTRAGRFDRSIEVRRPDFQGRMEGIKVHLRDKPIHDDIDYREVALLTSGMSGAQVAGVCNTACFLASREGRADITMADLRKAVEQAKYGKASDLQRFISPSRKHRFAVMEASISMIATLMPAIEPVDFVTILPSTKSPIGRTVLKPNIGRYTTGMWTKRYLTEQLLVALAGRAGEEVVYGRDEMSSLNQSRNMLARQIATKMLNAGMSDHPDFENLRGLGTTWYDPSFEPSRWQSYTVITDMDQSRSEWIDMDMEMELRINRSYEEVKALINRNRTCLDLLIELLMARERVDGEEIRQVVEGAAHPDDLARRTQEASVLL